MISGAALVCFVAGLDTVGYWLVGVAVAVAVLNAVTGLCLGCKVYELVRRF